MRPPTRRDLLRFWRRRDDDGPPAPPMARDGFSLEAFYRARAAAPPSRVPGVGDGVWLEDDRDDR